MRKFWKTKVFETLFVHTISVSKSICKVFVHCFLSLQHFISFHVIHLSYAI